MSRRPLGSAAALSLAGALALLTYLFWTEIVTFVLTIAGARVMWVIAKAKLGIHSQRSGKSLWEVIAALLGGYIVGRKGKDAVSQAVATGAEIQIRVPRRPSRYSR